MVLVEFFELWAFRKCILLCVSNVHYKEYTPLKQNRCIFLYILVWNIFSDLHVTCGPRQGGSTPLQSPPGGSAHWSPVLDTNFTAPQGEAILDLLESKKSPFTENYLFLKSISSWAHLKPWLCGHDSLPMISLWYHASGCHSNGLLFKKQSVHMGPHLQQKVP